MGAGAPDFWQYRARSGVTAVYDLGELAVRVGSPVAFDRAGDVIWWDSFEEGVGRWRSTASGGGYGVRVTTALSRWGGYAAELWPGTAAGATAGMVHTETRPVSGRLGVSFIWNTEATDGRFQLGVTHSDGNEKTRWFVGIDFDDNALEYSDSTATWVTLGTLDKVTRDVDAWHPIKLVVDLQAYEYVRLLFEEDVFDLSGVAAQVLSIAGERKLEFRLSWRSTGGGGRGFLIDAFVLTQNEP